MKKYLLTLLLALFSVAAFAQVQQGVVKTRGRMVNGQLVEGRKLSGATITLNFGNPLRSGQNGAFSFNVPVGNSFSLVSAKKQGYTLADAEFTRRTFKFSSSNPFYVVLEDEAQRQADINAATRKVRKTLNAQLEKREEEIEALKAQNKLTESEYQQLLQELYDGQSKELQMIEEMAERYAAIDYDQLDEFNRQVQLYIEEGELVKADSLIRSKGDIEQRVEEYHQTVAANEVMRKKLELSEQSVAKALEDISQDLYNQRTIYIQQNKRDSALYCLVLRADLDTLNYETAYECASYAQVMTLNDSIAEKYYLRCLNIATVRQDKAFIAEAQHNLGHLYSFFGLGETPDYYLDLGRSYLLQALSNREELYAANPDLYRQDFANTLYQLCLWGLNNENYEETIIYGIEANKQYRILVCQDDIKERTNIEDQFLWCYQKIVEATCWLLEATKAYEKGLAYISENIEVVDSVAVLSLQRWDSPYTHHNVGELYYQLGRLYHTLTDFSKAERFYVQAAEHLEYAYRQDHETGYGRLGDTWWDMMKLYKETENMEAYDLYLEKSIELYSSDLRENRTELIGLYYNKMLRYIAKKQIDEALAWASANFELDKDDLIAKTGKVMALAYKADEHINKKEYDEAITIIDYAITLVPDSASISAYCIKEEMTELISGLLKNVQVCKTALYVAKSEILVEQDKKNAALENYELLVSEIANDNDETLAQLYIKVLELCESLDEKEKYDLYLDNALELYTKLYESQPSIFMASLIELQNKKVRSLLQNHNTDEAIDLARRTYAMDESNRRSKSYLAACNNRKAYEYARQADFDNAYHCIDEAISLRPIHPNFYDSKGEILLMQGRNDEALAMWKKVLELNPNFLDNYPDGTNLSNGLKKLGLIE